VAVDKRGFGRALRFQGTGSAGTDHAGYFAVDDPLATEASEPVDMAQVRADDAFIEALANANPSTDADLVDERMASLLLSWREDVSSETAGPVIDLDTAVAAIRNAPRPPAKRQLFGSLAAAAAVMIIAFTGIGLAARDAVPGNPLFGVTKVLYSDKAKSVEAAVAVRTQLDAATEALASGRVDEAQAAIAQAQQKLPGVAAEDGQGALVAQAEQLMAQLQQQQQLTPALPAPTSDVPSPLLPLETTPAPTPQPTVDTTTPEPVTTTVPTTPPPISTTDGSETTAPSATAEGPSSLGASSVQQASGGKSGESLSEEPVSGTSSQGSGP
jgi:anti-sigma-D factor RsdA-like protein